MNFSGSSRRVLEKDLIHFRKAVQYSSVDSTFLEQKCLCRLSNIDEPRNHGFSPVSCKRPFRSIISTYDHTITNNLLRSSRSSTLLRIFNGFSHFPLLKKKGYLFSNLISWIIGSTYTYADRTGQGVAADDPSGCRFCNNSPETRYHLLSDCPGTIHLLSDFLDGILQISKFKREEFNSISKQDQWLWILGGGIIPLPKDEFSYRISSIELVLHLEKV